MRMPRDSLHLGLTEVIRKALRAQRSIERELILHEIGRDDPLARKSIVALAGTRLEHHAFYFHIIEHIRLSTPQAFESIVAARSPLRPSGEPFNASSASADVNPMDSNASVAPFTAASAAGASGRKRTGESPDKVERPLQLEYDARGGLFPTPGIFEMSAVS